MTDKEYAKTVSDIVLFALRAPGAITAVCEHRDAMRIVACMVRKLDADPARMAAMRAKLKACGQLDHDVEYVFARARQMPVERST